MNNAGIFHKGEYYGWNAVYLISGLCSEDFLYDSIGSWEHFIGCLDNHRRPAIEFDDDNPTEWGE